MCEIPTLKEFADLLFSSLRLRASVRYSSHGMFCHRSPHSGGMVPWVAALFVDQNGCYPKFVNVDCWDVTRDARNYGGPYPVVAHPPCNLWVNFAALNYKRYGGEHNRPGNDGGCFASALRAVRQYGGVLEHPADSRAWIAFDLVRPRACGWNRVTDLEWTCEVWQSAYGHQARKRTWLWYCGEMPFELNWTRKPGVAQIGWFDRLKPTLSKAEASKTPRSFAATLLKLARLKASHSNVMA